MPAKFTCQFMMDSATFHDPTGDYGRECSEILLGIAAKVEDRSGGEIRDRNGNRIGKWSIR